MAFSGNKYMNELAVRVPYRAYEKVAFVALLFNALCEARTKGIASLIKCCVTVNRYLTRTLLFSHLLHYHC